MAERTASFKSACGTGNGNWRARIMLQSTRIYPRFRVNRGWWNPTPEWSWCGDECHRWLLPWTVEQEPGVLVSLLMLLVCLNLTRMKFSGCSSNNLGKCWSLTQNKMVKQLIGAFVNILPHQQVSGMDCCRVWSCSMAGVWWDTDHSPTFTRHCRSHLSLSQRCLLSNYHRVGNGSNPLC